MEYLNAFLCGGLLCAIGQLLIDKTRLTNWPMAHRGVREAVQTDGWLGVFTGGVKNAAGGITAAIVFGGLAALLFRPKAKA